MSLERAGVPSVTVITEPFAFKARAEVKALGMPDLPIQVLPHPIGQLSNESMEAIADEAFSEVEFCLMATAEEVSTAYTGAVTPRLTYSRSTAIAHEDNDPSLNDN